MHGLPYQSRCQVIPAHMFCLKLYLESWYQLRPQRIHIIYIYTYIYILVSVYWILINIFWNGGHLPTKTHLRQQAVPCLMFDLHWCLAKRTNPLQVNLFTSLLYPFVMTRRSLRELGEDTDTVLTEDTVNIKVGRGDQDQTMLVVVVWFYATTRKGRIFHWLWPLGGVIRRPFFSPEVILFYLFQSLSLRLPLLRPLAAPSRMYEDTTTHESSVAPHETPYLYFYYLIAKRQHIHHHSLGWPPPNTAQHPKNYLQKWKKWSYSKK